MKKHRKQRQVRTCAAPECGQLDMLPKLENISVTNDGIDVLDPPELASVQANDAGSITEMRLDVDESLDETIGQRFRRAREQRGWSCEEVGARLKLQAGLIRRLERDDYSGIEHSVYLRGYLTSYARLLDLPADMANPVVASVGTQAPLVATGTVSRSRYMLDRYSVSATYLILTALVIGPAVWLATHGGLEQNMARTVLLDAPATPVEAAAAIAPVATSIAVDLPEAASPKAEALAGTDVDSEPVSEPVQPIVASMAPFTKPAETASSNAGALAEGQHQLEIRLNEPSWVEITTAAGERLEYGLLGAGVTHRYSSEQAISVRIGNAAAADVVADGKRIDLTPFRRANVAHMRVFVDGQSGAQSVY